MSLSAISSTAVTAVPLRQGGEEATESAAERARETTQTQPAAKAAPAPGTGQRVDVSA